MSVTIIISILKITMMNNLKNNVQLIGRLGNNPELREFESGKKLASFSLATNESYKNNQGEQVQDTQWHTIVAWENIAESVVKLLEKGDEVAISGKLTYREFEQDGQKRVATEIQLREFLRTKSIEKPQEDS